MKSLGSSPRSVHDAPRGSVLLVLPSPPLPLVSGGHYRDWQLLNLLARRGRKPGVLYFGTADAGRMADPSPVEKLASSVDYGGDRVENPDASLLATALRKLGYACGIGATTYPFSYQYDAMGAGNKIAAAAAAVGAKTVVLRSFWCHHVDELHSQGLQVVANCPDYNTKLAWEMVTSTPRTLRRIGPLCNYLGVRRQERRFLPRCDEIWVPTRREAEDLSAATGHPRILVMPNLIDVDSYPDLSSSPGDGETLLFVANYAYQPNANAAQALLTEIFPAIKRRVPRARLVLVGRGLPPALQTLARTIDGVELAGFVDDLSAQYRRASLALLPVREGAGMLVKTLEAMAYGRPSVGFSQAYRGIDAEDGDAIAVAHSPAQFAQTASMLLDDAAARERMGRKAREFSTRHLSWTRGSEILAGSLAR